MAIIPVRSALIEFIWSGRFGTSVSRDPFYLFLNRDLTELDVIIAAQPLLNGALNEDTLDNGWVRIVIVLIFLLLLTTVDNIDWDAKTLVEGELESGGQTKRDGQLLVTGELPNL
jgi:hypothetical protein